MAGQHGSRCRYIDGCRCDDCRAANAEYEKDRLRRHAAGEMMQRHVSAATVSAVTPEPNHGPGPAERAVTEQLTGLSAAETQPALAEAALAMARILDNPRAVSQQPPAAGKLADILERLRKGSDQRRSRLAVVREMAKTGS